MSRQAELAMSAASVTRGARPENACLARVAKRIESVRERLRLRKSRLNRSGS